MTQAIAIPELMRGPAFTRRSLLGASLALPGCATSPKLTTSNLRPPIAPIRLDPGRITHITVCLRPFRAAGPRLDVETIGAKRIVHNYGHGGSGWSLSWGSAAIAARNAMADGARDIAVIGCGAIGITTALTLQRAGARVTIYARDRLPQTRSARATGVWSPDSRIAATDAVAPQFPALWEAMARHSFGMHQSYVGLPDAPVVWHDSYNLSDVQTSESPDKPGDIKFAHYYNSNLVDLGPDFRDLTQAENPFPVARARAGVQMQFNIAALGDRLLREFLTNGGALVSAEFAGPADFARLAQLVIVNCTGYGARALMADASIIPVRGQITWLAPQPEVDYGLFYRSVSIVPRPEGIVVQYVGPNEMFGVGKIDETPDHGEAERAIAAVAGLFSPAPDRART